MGMPKIVTLLTNRLRLDRPRRVFSVRADEVRSTRSVGRMWMAAGLVFAYLYVDERHAHQETLSRAQPVLVSVLGPDSRPVATFAADHMADDGWVSVAKAVAAQHVVRMREMTNPIDVSLARLDEGRYFVKDAAAAKYARFVGSHPYDDLAKRRLNRQVRLEEVGPSLESSQSPSSRRLRVIVQWPERTWSGTKLEQQATRVGWVDVERVDRVPPDYRKANPLGIFVVDYDTDTPTG
jgi:hypothetical protein